MIILEGLDATGKSTLALALHNKTHWPVVTSEGPEKFPGEIIKRCLRYEQHHPNVIYDRHPIISQSVYSKFSKATPVPPLFIEKLKSKNPIIIYSVASNRGEHIVKPHDTPEHLKMIEEKRLGLEEEYLKLLNQHFPNYVTYKFGEAEDLTNKIYKQLYGDQR